jgi:arylsulfatase A-like enzyme
VNLLDMQVGKLIDQLKEAGLYEQTIIVFTGDNGPAIHRGKCFLYDRGIAAPLIVRVPAAFKPDFKPGAVIDDLVATGIDLAPTFVHWAGGKTPDYMKGRIFFGPDKQPAPEYIFGLRDRHDAEIDRIRSVRSKDFKYLRNYYPEKTYDEIGMNNVLATRAMRAAFKQGKLPPEQAAYFQKKAKEELYDLEKDPFELRNLVDNPASSGTLQKMRAALDHWIIETNDEGRIQEDPKLVEESFKTLLKTRENRGDKPKKNSDDE